jgi:hypothetical protein
VEVSGVSGLRNGATSGAASVTVVGSGMGVGQFPTIGIRFGRSSCLGSSWVSDNGVFLQGLAFDVFCCFSFGFFIQFFI